MDFAYLFNILLRRKWLLLSVVALASVATWLFVGKLPPAFKASSVISTGIIDYKGVSIQRDNPFIQKFQIESSFSGLIEKMKSRSSIKVLTDKLLAHDLFADGTTTKPFRVPDEEDREFTDAELNDVVLKLKTNNSDTSGTDKSVNEKPRLDQPGIRVAEAYKYDYESLLKKLNVQRIGETDYLTIEFESESPELSYFVVNTFIEEFMRQHEEDISYDETVALKFYKEQVETRKAKMDSIVNEINLYKKINGLVDVTTQRESVVTHMKDLELKLEETRQQIPALRTSIAFLENQIAEYNRVNGDILTNEILFNDDFQTLDEEIKKLNVQRVERISQGDRNVAALDAKIKDLRTRRLRVMNRGLSELPQEERTRIDDRLRTLVTEHLEKKLELEFAIEAKRSYEVEIAKMTGRAGKLLADDSYLFTLEAEHERLQKEYLKSTEDYDEAKLHAEGTENPLSIIEPAEIPVEPEPSNRAVFSAFAGIAGGTLTSILLFVLAFVDSSIRSPSRFQQIAQLPMLGYLNRVKLKGMDLRHLFANTQSKADLEAFKENVRKLRTTVEGSGAKSFLFVSPKEQEGRSFLILLLAYALSLNNKRVLIVDTNFKNNTLSKSKGLKSWNISTEKEMIGESANEPDPQLKNIDIVPNKGGSQSPSEVLAGKNFKQVIDNYSKKYDFIFLEAASMNKFSDARELIPFVEKLIAVFSSESPIGSTDRDTFEYLRSMNGKLFGGVLNHVDLKNL